MSKPSFTPLLLSAVLPALLLSIAANGADAQSWGSSGITIAQLSNSCLWSNGVTGAGVNTQGQVAFECFNGGSDHSSDVQAAVIAASGVDLVGPTGLNSFGVGINDAGQIVGVQHTDVGSQAFFYNGSSIEYLPTLGGTIAGAAAINDVQQIVGSSTTATGATHPFLYSGSGLTDLGTLGGDFAYAVDINQSGEVAGTSTTASGSLQAFLYSDGVMQGLGGGMTEAMAINDAGTVVGRDNASHHAFVYRDGVMSDLGTLGPSYDVSGAYGISDGGQIVGISYNSATGEGVGTLWEHGTPYALSDIVGGGWTFREDAPNPLWTIGRGGDILAWGQLDGADHEVLLTPDAPATTVTPEPASFWLLAIGLLGVGLLVHLRRGVLA